MTARSPLPTRLTALAVGSLLTASLAACGASSSGGAASNDGGFNGGTAAASSSSSTSNAASSGESSSAVTEATVSQPVTVDLGADDLAKVTVTSPTFTAKPYANAGTSRNGTYLVVDVEWETVQRSTYSNSLYFTAKDAKGHSSKPGLLPDETMLKARKLAEGEKETGSLAFDVAKGPVTLVIIDASQHELAHIKVPA